MTRFYGLSNPEVRRLNHDHGDGEEETFECYVFNKKLHKGLDDMCCEHCAKFLTTDCKRIDEFLEDIDEFEGGEG